MALKLMPLLLWLAHISAAPSIDLYDLEVADDVEAVGSYVRAVRAAAPPEYRTYENEGDGDIGYSRKKDGGGKKGYQYFDSFHKKGGDNYELETQDAYGQDDGKKGDTHGDHYESSDDGGYETKQNYRIADEDEQDKAHSHKHGRKGRSYDSADDDNYDVETLSKDHRKPEAKAKKLKKSRESSSEDDHDQEKPHHENDHEELREGSPDGNGGVEAHGYDPADYTVPDKYSYGKAEEYDF